MMFFNCLNFFAFFFFEISSPGLVGTEFRTNFFFFSFSAYLTPFWIEIMLERGFLIFWIFLLFFWNFHARVEYERNSGLKFFFSFSAFLIPVWTEIMPEWYFFNIFFNFLLFFWEYSCPGRVGTEFGTKFFFLSFSAYFILFWL